MTDTPEPNQIVDGDKSAAVLNFLITVTEGPRDAFGVLIIVLLRLYEMNAEMGGKKTSNAELIEEVRIAIESAKVVYESHPH